MRLFLVCFLTGLFALVSLPQLTSAALAMHDCAGCAELSADKPQGHMPVQDNRGLCSDMPGCVVLAVLPDARPFAVAWLGRQSYARPVSWPGTTMPVRMDLPPPRL
ncbi:hypothetical protein [Marinibacterium profundimaris]|uniref:Uncharacterized protein n=1 Tax=Marinibacterium profundimaris TaxID=1679460 RepID=A0A225NKY7_9RHOB|nr:hypothetical protein [Marinibacterium profundimaris]OWU74848.1 hypothetical protein ATO3_09680 [Marinibacterium profundimaris]